VNPRRLMLSALFACFPLPFATLAAQQPRGVAAPIAVPPAAARTRAVKPDPVRARPPLINNKIGIKRVELAPKVDKSQWRAGAFLRALDTIYR
jgi:hypothetical protein